VTMRGLRMFEQVQVPILGVVENMSGFVCSHCGKTTEIFRSGGGKKAAEEFGVPFLGAIPLDASVAAAGDAGEPIVAAAGRFKTDSPVVRAFLDVAGRMAQELSIVNERTMAVRFRPSEAKIEGGNVIVKWTDNRESVYSHRELRLACPCAMCVDEWIGENRLEPKTVPGDVRVLDIRPVGRYALQFNFSDGHATGIYSYDKLRELDPRSVS